MWSPAWSRARHRAAHWKTRSTGRSAPSRRVTAPGLPTDAQAGTHRAPRQAGPADGRSAGAQSSARDDQTEQVAAVHAAPAGRQSAAAAARAASAASPRDRDRADPLAAPGDRRDTARYQAHGGDSGKHVTDAALQAAEEIRQARSAERVLDETAAGGSGLVVDS